MRSIKLHFDRFLRAILIFMRAWMNRGKKSSARPCHPFQSGYILLKYLMRKSQVLGAKSRTYGISIQHEETSKVYLKNLTVDADASNFRRQTP